MDRKPPGRRCSGIKIQGQELLFRQPPLLFRVRGTDGDGHQTDKHILADKRGADEIEFGTIRQE